MWTPAISLCDSVINCNNPNDLISGAALIGLHEDALKPEDASQSFKTKFILT